MFRALVLAACLGASAFAQVGARSAVVDFAKFKSPDADVRVKELEHLRDGLFRLDKQLVKQVVSELLPLLRDVDFQVRELAIGTLSYLLAIASGDPVSIHWIDADVVLLRTALTPCLKDVSDEVRREAYETLHRLKAAVPQKPWPQGDALTLELLRNDPCDRVRMAAAEDARVGVRTRGSLPAILRNERSAPVRQAILKSISWSGPFDAELSAAVVAALADSDCSVRLSAAQALAGPLHAKVPPELIDALADPVPEVRIAALATLAISKGNGLFALPAIVDCLSDPDPRVRVGALDAAAKIAGTGTVSKLRVGLADPSIEVRRAAVGHFPRLGIPTADAIPMLIKLLGDPDESITANAAIHLGAFTSDAAAVVPALLAAFERDEHGMAHLMVDALGGFVAKSPEAAAALQVMQGHPNRWYRDKAKSVLAQSRRDIGPGPFAVPSLVRKLGGNDVAERISAAIRLQRCGEKTADAIPALVTALDDAAVRPFAIAALGSLDTRRGEAQTRLLEAVGSKDPVRRAGAARALSHAAFMNPEVARKLGAVAKSDADKSARLEAIRALSRYGGYKPLSGHAEAVDGACAACADVEADVRRAAVAALVRLDHGSQPVRTALLARLADADLEVRLASLDAIVKFHRYDHVLPPSVATALTEGTRQPGRYADRCLSAMYELNIPLDPAAWLPVLRRALSHDDESIRYAAALLTQRCGPAAREAIPELIRLREDGRARVRMAAVIALAKLGGPEAIASLTAALDDPEPEVRHRAAEKLGELGLKAAAALPSLLKMARDGGFKPEFRTSGAEAAAKVAPDDDRVLTLQLERLRSPESWSRYVAALWLDMHPSVRAIPDLAAAASDPCSTVRSRSLRALSRFERLPDDVAPAIRKAVGDPDPNVREAALRAAGKLDPALQRPLIDAGKVDSREAVRQAARWANQ